MEDVPKKPIPRFQFSLGALFAATLASGAVGVIWSSALLQASDDYARIALFVSAAVLTFLLGTLTIITRARAMTRVELLVVFVAVHAMLSYRICVNEFRQSMARNETNAVSACKAYCTAQDIYRRTDYNKDGLLEYAQSLHDLYETKPGAADLRLIHERIIGTEGRAGVAKSYHGYYFRVLKAQGAKASGGARSYVANGRMVLGYALIAWPAKYDVTGRNVFIVSNAGTIYQKDMGSETTKLVEAITEFAPDITWGGDYLD